MGSTVPIHLHSLKLLTFDATGTLLRFARPPTVVYREFGAKYGFNVNPEDLEKSFKNQWKLLNRTKPHFGPCWKTWWTEFVVGTFKGSIPDSQPVIDEKLKSVANDLIAHFRKGECWALKPGAAELLERLRNFKTMNPNELKLGVISNFDPRLREILQAVGIASYFDFILLSHELQISKPDPAIFNYAVNKYLGNSDSQVSKPCLHVGDNYELDFVAANSAGWKGALILPKDKRDFKVSTGQSECSNDDQNNRVVVYESLNDLSSMLVS